MNGEMMIRRKTEENPTPVPFQKSHQRIKSIFWVKR
jgi:hypothetical protein